jgi:hypothetical protein
MITISMIAVNHFSLYYSDFHVHVHVLVHVLPFAVLMHLRVPRTNSILLIASVGDSSFILSNVC